MDRRKGMLILLPVFCLVLLCWQLYSHNTRWEEVTDSVINVMTMSQEEIDTVNRYEMQTWKIPAILYIVCIIVLSVYRKRAAKDVFPNLAYGLYMFLAIFGLLCSIYVAFDVFCWEAG